LNFAVSAAAPHAKSGLALAEGSTEGLFDTGSSYFGAKGWILTIPEKN
jgi:hypothetical protein